MLTESSISEGTESVTFRIQRDVFEALEHLAGEKFLMPLWELFLKKSDC